MPLLGSLLIGLLDALAVFLGKYLTSEWAIRWGSRTLLVGLMLAFFTAVQTCINGLFSMTSHSGLPSPFLNGVGMFIPSNAGTVLSCWSSVWAACVVYSMKSRVVGS